MKLDNQSIKYITLFEGILKVTVKDIIFFNGKILFIVKEADISRAIGSRGKNVQRIEKLINKKIKLIGYNDDPVKFVKNYLLPLVPRDVSLNDSKIEISSQNRRDKGLFIGKNRQNQEMLQKIIGKYFKGKELKII